MVAEAQGAVIRRGGGLSSKSCKSFFTCAALATGAVRALSAQGYEKKMSGEI